MREIPGRRRWLLSRRAVSQAALGGAALDFATVWQWPVLPGVAAGPAVPGDGGPAANSCACPDPECVVPGAHPFDPPLLAATTDARMVRWWWANRPGAPIVLATGGSAPCAVSLPAAAGALALEDLDRLGVRLGPVVATSTRWSLLVAPYSLEALGELLYSKDRVPSSLRFHSAGGYVVLPPSQTGRGAVSWVRAPSPDPRPRPGGAGAGPGAERPWLPDVETVVDALIEASTSAPDGGSRLAY